MSRNYYFSQGNGAIISEEGSRILINTASKNFKMNSPSKANNFAIEFEVLSTTGNIALGIGEYSTASSRLAYTGSYSTGFSINFSDGVLYHNNAIVATLNDFKATLGDVLAIKVNLNKIATFFKNGRLVYSYTIPFSYEKLIFEAGTGTQINGEIRINYKWVYNYSSPRYDGMLGNYHVLNNPKVNKYYSLSGNTLIHLPDNTTESIIEHGVEQGKFIQLDVPFDKHRYFNNTPVDGTSGKVFTHDIGVINTLSIKEFKENQNFEPIYTWYNTNMTSNTAPSPLVASASGSFTSSTVTYYPYDAFNGNIKTKFPNDGWATPQNTTTGWIQLDFGEEKNISCYALSLRGSSETTAYQLQSAPISWELLGSNNNADFVTVHKVDKEYRWSSNNTRLVYSLDSLKSYRYWRINILENNGKVDYTTVGQLMFGLNRMVN